MRAFVSQCLLGLLLLTGLPAAMAADKPWREDLGRLFLTPEKRALLDELRRNNARITPSAEQPENLRLDGIVRRSNGRQTIWINGQAYGDDAPITSNDERSARIITGDRKGARLKVGESLRIAPAEPAQ
ncbi:hypothetical protein [Viridibacterium curvum]|uniref:MSHA biogenesis protein MshK n=1 Tax=Viridibacterium curvum TaxID=1101404 RepID=A0ABP9R0J7_9RHOO